jgi:hypothetical protein
VTQEALYLELTRHFQQRAAVRSQDDKHLHTDAPLVSLVHALQVLAVFSLPALQYIAEHAGKHVVERVTDAAIERARAAARKLAEHLKHRSDSPSVKYDPREARALNAEADEFADELLRQAQSAERSVVEGALEAGRVAAEQMLAAQPGFKQEEAHRISISIVVEVRRAAKRTEP